MSGPTYPTGEIGWILTACKADEPLGPQDPRRYDFTELLGHAPTSVLTRTLIQKVEAGRYLHLAFTGHKGSGKSTALLQLKEWAENHEFLPVYIEVDRRLGTIDLQFSDLFLLAAELVEEEMIKFGAPLPKEKLEEVRNWFAEVVKESDTSRKAELEAGASAEIKGGLFIVAQILAKFRSSIQVGSEAHHKVREKLRQSPDVLVGLVNGLFDAARIELEKKKRTRGLLIVFDNLDRYSTEVVDKLLIKGVTLRKSLGCHAVFTLPIDLPAVSSQPIQDAFDATAFLPMLPTRRRGKPWGEKVTRLAFNPKALDAMVAALAKRIQIHQIFEDPRDAKTLALYSGGCMRDLMHLVVGSYQKTEAPDDSDPTRLSKKGVASAVKSYRTTLCEGLTPDDRKRLALVALGDRSALTQDKQMLGYLSKRWVLHYRSDDVDWYDVHPLLIEEEDFRREFKAKNPGEADPQG